MQQTTISKSPRVEVVDALRGFAVLAILLVHNVAQAIYGGGQPSGEAHARLKEALVQRGVFTNGLMRKPVLPLNQEEKDWISQGLKNSKMEKVDMSQYR